MQRRAAAAYVVFFLVIAAGAYAVLATAQAPTITMDDPDYELAQGDQVTIEGRSYVVSAVTAEKSSGGGHGGGGGGITHSATLTWTDSDANFTQEWTARETRDFKNVTVGGERLNASYMVVVANTSDVSNATLREAPEDLNTTEIDGTTYVVNETPDGKEVTRITEYEPLNRVQISEGELEYNGNTTTVDVTASAVVLSWTAPKDKNVEIGQSANVSLGAQGNTAEYFSYFPNNSTLTLTQNPQGVESYLSQSKTVEKYHERENGLWGIAILSILTAIFMIGLAYLPHKDT